MDGAGNDGHAQVAVEVKQQEDNRPQNTGGGEDGHAAADGQQLDGGGRPQNAGGGEDGHAAADRQQPDGGDLPQDAAGGGGGGGGGGRHAPDFAANDAGTLLVVATLITALSYQLGTNIPGGYWQDDSAGHVAGDPIMRDKHRRRYWLFMAASWAGFGSSMLLTVGLLTGVPVRSQLVLWPFVVAYSSLVLTFVTSQPRTSLAIDLIIWVAVMAVLAFATKCRRLDRLRCWGVRR